MSLIKPYKIKFIEDKDKIQSIHYLVYLKGKIFNKLSQKERKVLEEHNLKNGLMSFNWFQLDIKNINIE